MENLQLKSWGKTFFENDESEVLSLIFYRKDDCEIYELPNNRIIKFSSSNEGYTTARQLCGKKNKNIVDKIPLLRYNLYNLNCGGDINA